MRKIRDEFTRIESSKGDLGGSSFFSRAHKKFREWHVLGAVQRILAGQNFDHPVYATEEEEPDFLTFRADHSVWSPVEIVEVLRPDYRRQDFHKKLADRKAPNSLRPLVRLKEPFAPLRTQLAKKAGKKYATQSTLFVYFDIGRLSFDDWTTPFHTQLVREHLRQPFDGADSFKRVLVTSSDFESLVELHPNCLVIKEDIIQ